MPERGARVSAEDAADVSQIVSELEEEGSPAGPDWNPLSLEPAPARRLLQRRPPLETRHLSDDLPGGWQLRYTTSKAFHRNGGLTGYAADFAAVETPQLTMKIERRAEAIS